VQQRDDAVLPPGKLGVEQRRVDRHDVTHLRDVRADRDVHAVALHRDRARAADVRRVLLRLVRLDAAGALVERLGVGLGDVAVAVGRLAGDTADDAGVEHAGLSLSTKLRQRTRDRVGEVHHPAS